MRSDEPYDFIAVGLGPFNLGLACLADPLPGVRGLFLERNREFGWHPGMLLDGTTLQNPFLADLVSMADPTNRYSYLNYCKQQGRLYTYYIRENFYLSRQEYDRYGKWAAGQLPNIRYRHDVQDVRHDPDLPGYTVTGIDAASGRPFAYACRKLVIGIGSTPRLPECCASARRGPLVHTADYLANKEFLQGQRAITVVGSGQSGAEVYFDLLKDSGRHGYALNWVTRSQRFFQMENAKLTLELISPDYIDHFHALDSAAKTRILEDQRSIYNGINQRLIDQIYDHLDERRHTRHSRTQLLTNLALDGCRYDDYTRQYELEFRHVDLGTRYRHRTGALVLATGYRHQPPPFIEGIRARIDWDEQGRYRQARNYAVDLDGSEIFVQNAGLHSHGLTNPDLGLACHRNSRLIHALTGVDHYRAEARTTFQDFVPAADSGFELLAGRTQP